MHLELFIVYADVCIRDLFFKDSFSKKLSYLHSSFFFLHSLFSLDTHISLVWDK